MGKIHTHEVIESLDLNFDSHCRIPPQKDCAKLKFLPGMRNLTPSALDNSGNNQSLIIFCQFRGRTWCLFLFYVSLIMVKVGIFSCLYWPSSFFLYVSTFEMYIALRAVLCLFFTAHRAHLSMSAHTLLHHSWVLYSCVGTVLSHQFLIVGHSSRSPSCAVWAKGIIIAEWRMEHSLISLEWIPKRGIAGQGTHIL